MDGTPQLHFNFTTIDEFFSSQKATRIKSELKANYPDTDSVPVTELLNSNNKDIRDFATFLFEKDYAPYTSKQWGIPVNAIDPSVLKRVPVYLSYDEGYFKDAFQAMPKNSFTEIF